MRQDDEFSNVDIRIGEGAESGRYPVTIETPVGDASNTSHLDPASKGFQQTLQAIEDGETDEPLLFDFGKHLFSALFPGPLATIFRTALGHTHGEGKRLRLRLRLRPPELSALPWEFLYDSIQDLFLGISSQVVLSRYVVDAPAFKDPLAVTPPLRLLVAFSSPTDVVPLDLDRERRVLIQATQRAVDTGRLEIHLLKHTTNAALRAALRDFRPHIFHFVGHGEFDGQRGSLLFESESGKARRVQDRTLREFFSDASHTKLAVLNACQGAATTAGQAISGLAPYLVQRGLPAVVAMRYPVPDDTAVIFAREFYAALTHETPAAVDVAVAAGRRAIYQDVDPDGPDWGIPNVFMRADDGTIFAKLETDAQKQGTETQIQVGDVSDVSGTVIISGNSVVTGNRS